MCRLLLCNLVVFSVSLSACGGADSGPISRGGELGLASDSQNYWYELSDARWFHAVVEDAPQRVAGTWNTGEALPDGQYSLTFSVNQLDATLAVYAGDDPRTLITAPGQYSIDFTLREKARVVFVAHELDDSGRNRIGVNMIVLTRLGEAEPPEPVRKWNPGHYVAMNGRDPLPARFDAVQEPGVAGVQVRYPWNTLEPSFNSYDFSVIRNHLDALEGTGLQLVAFIHDKSFKHGEYYTPPYLWDEHTMVTSKNSRGGTVSKRWQPYVVARMTRLVEAISAEFDAHPGFEGIAFQETSISVTNSDLSAAGYTPEAYRDALITLYSNAAALMPRSRVFAYMNFLSGNNNYLMDIMEEAAPLGVAVGGPDLLPDSYSLNRHIYPKIQALRPQVEQGLAITFSSCQYDSFRHDHADPNADTKYWTPTELIDWGVEELLVGYLFWNRPVVPDPADSYSIQDAFEAIEQHPNLFTAP